MLKTLQETCTLIETGKWFHISGSANLLKQLPKGNWIGGSNVYFMDSGGGVVTDQQLGVLEIPYAPCKINQYTAENIENITSDAYDNGFSIIIIPSESRIRDVYSLKAPEFKDIFLKNIIGWVSGTNLAVPGQIPIVVNGQTGECFSDQGVAMHVTLPEDKVADIGIINIFSADESRPVIEFFEDSTTVDKCLIGGVEVSLAEYIQQNNISTKLPLVGEFFGANLNLSIINTENGTVSLGAPCFAGIKYRFGMPVDDYPKAFMDALEEFKGVEAVFACNCVFNFLFGELEGKRIDCFYGPMSFGEIAYQLLNQTLVYLIVS